MIILTPDELSLPLRLAVSYAPASIRHATLGLMVLDQRLANFVRQAHEPILAQMRIAWWRDELAKPPANRSKGDPLLEVIGQFWRGEEAVLLGLVDGWEQLLSEPPLTADIIDGFVDARAEAFVALARISKSVTRQQAVRVAAKRWALADLSANLSRPVERDAAITAARALGDERMDLPRTMRPLAVLDGLARKSIRRGGTPLLGDRWAALHAIRLGLFGR